MNSDSLASTYVRHGEKWWNVSTVDRESSSILGGRYAETCVWEWDSETRKRGEFLGNVGEASEGSIYAHQKIVEALHRTGELPKEDDHEG